MSNNEETQAYLVWLSILKWKVWFSNSHILSKKKKENIYLVLPIKSCLVVVFTNDINVLVKFLILH